MKILFRVYFVIPFIAYAISVKAQPVSHNILESGSRKIFTLENNFLSLKVAFENNNLLNDSLIGNSDWFQSYGSSPVTMVTDAGFALNIVWTDWLAPGKKNNGDNPVILDKENFRLKKYTTQTDPDGSKELLLTMVAVDNPLQVVLVYHLSPGKFYFRKKVEVRDTFQQVHFLQTISTLKGYADFLYTRAPGVKAPVTVINPGGFGQPLAVVAGKAGVFLGVEYPSSINTGKLERDRLAIELTQEIGQKINNEPLSSEWTVISLLPEPYPQSWFYDYLKDIRVAPAEPYTLYNSWYDLRSPEYPGVKPANIMNDENIFRIIDLFKKNMIEKHNIHMDAFVLDDGWDVYQSDWVMRKETFPHGFKPIADRLKEMGTNLGVWLGPTGGYSFRMKRVDWMKQHGYEVVGEGRDYAMLCLGGKNYSALFEKRVTGMVRDQGISYFKWDGIQFSCSEANHGHATGIYSRNAILESLIGKCKAVRNINPSTYLNITSGTWLSPWWLKYANQIWMDGGDYGFADVPSVNMRDAAITYRDFVLYDDFVDKGLWFPVANLMTHGIIKGNLENVGGENDPIEKFTNDVVLYFARGISMYELYISPDLLNDREWEAIGKSVQWAKDKKDILAKTFMTGGNPTKGETYGYVHFKGSKGILAARNPVVTPGTLNIKLKPDFGLAYDAQSLVIEKVYPYHYILPRLYSAGDIVEIPLDGFETAIYEVYTVSDATTPLPAACRFDLLPAGGTTWQLKLYQGGPNSVFLNAAALTSMQWEGKQLTSLRDLPQPRLAPAFHCSVAGAIDPFHDLHYSATQDAALVQLCYLFKPVEQSNGKEMPALTALVDGQETAVFVEKEKGKWYWLSVNVKPGDHDVRLILKKKDSPAEWKGTVEVWAKTEYPQQTQIITLQTSLKAAQRVFPPSPLTEGNTSSQYKIGSGDVNF